VTLFGVGGSFESDPDRANEAAQIHRGPAFVGLGSSSTTDGPGAGSAGSRPARAVDIAGAPLDTVVGGGGLSAVVGVAGVRTVRAKFSYTARSDRELDFAAGALIHVFEDIDEHWVKGALAVEPSGSGGGGGRSGGRSGYIPSSYITSAAVASSALGGSAAQDMPSPSSAADFAAPPVRALSPQWLTSVDTDTHDRPHRVVSGEMRLDPLGGGSTFSFEPVATLGRPHSNGSADQNTEV
jgi:hypothetical protein